MRITGIETIRLKSQPNLIWVEIETDEGIVGLGETFRGAEAVETYLHSMAAPLILGENPLDIERLHKVLFRGYLGFNGSGVESRAASAIDIACGISSARLPASPCTNCWVALVMNACVPTIPAPVLTTIVKVFNVG